MFQLRGVVLERSCRRGNLVVESRGEGAFGSVCVVVVALWVVLRHCIQGLRDGLGDGCAFHRYSPSLFTESGNFLSTLRLMLYWFFTALTIQQYQIHVAYLQWIFALIVTVLLLLVAMAFAVPPLFGRELVVFREIVDEEIGEGEERPLLNDE